MDKRPLKVFLCHAHADREPVRALYARLKREGVDVWLDKEKLLPGQDWEYEIRKAVRESDVVVVCLSKQFNQAGFRQKEVRIALDTAMEKPEGEIFIIPARLEECDSLESLSKWHWVDLFESNGFQLLMRALRIRAEKIGAELRQRKGGGTPVSRPKIKQAGTDDDARLKAEQDALEKARLDAEEQERQKAAKEQADRESAAKAARDQAERDVIEKARLNAEELERQKAAKAQADREAVAKAARDKAEQDAIKKARLDAEELERQKAAKEQADLEAAAKAARDKAERDAIEKARLDAEELEQQKAVKAQADRDAIARARLDADKLEREKNAKRLAQPKRIKPNTAIVVVVIGLVGILCVALISSPLLRGVFSRTPEPTATLVLTPSQTKAPLPTNTSVPSKIPTEIPTETASPTSFTWAYDLAFVSDRGDTVGQLHPVIVNSNDSAQYQEYENPPGYNQTTGPTFCGDLLAVEASENPNNGNRQWVYVYDENGQPYAWDHPENADYLGVPRCSPNGQYLAYTAMSGGYADIHVANVNSGKILYQPDFRSYGKLAVYTSWLGDSSSFVVEIIISSNETYILTYGFPTSPYSSGIINLGTNGVLAMFSPDGSQAAFSCDEGQLCVSNLHSGSVNRIYQTTWNDKVTPEWIRKVTPVWSSDGQWIYFASVEGGDWDILRIRPDGSGLKNITAAWTSNEITPATR
ncbi:MAG: TIR domain-containing protein [Chloroflexota bacterium]